MIQVYTGNGKGKSTAGFGLALRAVGAGLKVYIGQFVKNGCYSEIKILKKIKGVTLEQFGFGCFIKKLPSKKDLELAEIGLNKIRGVIKKKAYDLVILDEVNVAIKLRLLKLQEVLDLIKNTPRNTELVLTGRHAHADIIKAADLVSEIKDLKHYYKRGIRARKGIEY